MNLHGSEIRFHSDGDGEGCGSRLFFVLPCYQIEGENGERQQRGPRDGALGAALAIAVLDIGIGITRPLRPGPGGRGPLAASKSSDLRRRPPRPATDASRVSAHGEVDAVYHEKFSRIVARPLAVHAGAGCARFSWGTTARSSWLPRGGLSAQFLGLG